MSKSKKKSTGFHHSKKLGQNFLTDHGVVEDIAIGSLADEDTLVIEIGPGQGVLTDELMNYAGALIAVELDDRLIPYLRTRFALNDRVEIVHGDILEIDLEELVREGKEKFNVSKVQVVGNLPYYITTPIIMKLLESINEKGTTVLVVTHNREIVDEMKKRVITMNRGVIISDEKEGGYIYEG